ncbi:two-component system sensor histidine kinase VicK [Pedobacter sp. UYEF25]
MKTTPDLLLSFAEHDPNLFFSFNVTTSQFVYTNQSFKKFFQLKSKTHTREAFFLMVHPDDRRALKKTCAALSSNIFKENIEFRMLGTQDHPERVFRLALLKGEQTEEEQIITGRMEDISAFRANENMLKEVIERKNAILNIMSHDLAGSLNSIKTFTYVLSKKLPVKENQQLNTILTSIGKLSENCIQMIQEFIQLEFIKSANVDFQKERKDLISTIENVIEEYVTAPQELAIAFEFKSSLPEIYADIDEKQFMQVVKNLISNAIKFTPDGGKIGIDITDKEESILIALADNGIGIPKKHHATLFEKFTPARRPGLRGEPSVGLGMSIIETIIDWHKGKIWFESEENVGSTFYIELAKSV